MEIKQKDNELDPRNDMLEGVRILDRRVYYKGQTIIEQGTLGFRAFYIEKGQVEIIFKEGPLEICIATLGEGEIFGEMSLIEHDMRSATVRAARETTVSLLSDHEIDKKLSVVDDKSITALIHVLIRRLRHANNGHMQQYKSLTEFQDRVLGMIDQAANSIDEARRRQLRQDLGPLLKQLDLVLDCYRV